MYLQLPNRIMALKADHCVDVCVARDHSVFLMESGGIFACGSNEYGQLGLGQQQQPTADKCLSPKPVRYTLCWHYCCKRGYFLKYSTFANSLDEIL